MELIAHKNMNELYGNEAENCYMVRSYNKLDRSKPLPSGTKEELLERLYEAVEKAVEKARKIPAIAKASIYYEKAQAYRYFICVLETL